ncbi:hypothetical protein PJI17_26860 [Mycobacterium kansasii]
MPPPQLTPSRHDEDAAGQAASSRRRAWCGGSIAKPSQQLLRAGVSSWLNIRLGSPQHWRFSHYAPKSEDTGLIGCAGADVSGAPQLVRRGGRARSDGRAPGPQTAKRSSPERGFPRPPQQHFRVPQHR